jgi:hypothetical protein
MQRAAALMPLGPLLGESGVDMAAVLEGTGVSLDKIGPDAFIPYAAFLAMLDNAGRLTGREDIGILLGRRQTLMALGPLGDVMRHAATLGEAIAAFAAFQSSNSTGGAVYLMRADRDVILGYGVYDRSEHISPKIYDLVLAVGCSLIAELTGGMVGPEEIHLSRAKPQDPTPYLRLARCPVRFGQHQTGILLRAPALGFALPAANRDLHEAALARLQSAREGEPMPLSRQVRHLLRPLLLMGNAGMDERRRAARPPSPRHATAAPARGNDVRDDQGRGAPCRRARAPDARRSEHRRHRGDAGLRLSEFLRPCLPTLERDVPGAVEANGGGPRAAFKSTPIGVVRPTN